MSIRITAERLTDPSLEGSGTNGSTTTVPPDFAFPSSPFYLLTAPVNIPNRYRSFKNSLQNNTICNKASAALSLFGQPLHLAYSIGYIANTILFFLKNTVSWLRTSLPMLGIATSGIELIKEVFDLFQLRKTALDVDLLAQNVTDNAALLKKKMNESKPLKQLLGKKIIIEITDAIGKKNFTLVKQRLHEQVKKAKIVHSICLLTLAASITSLAATMVLAPFSVILGVGIASSIASGMRHALISGYLHQKGHTLSTYAMIPRWMRKKIIEPIHRKLLTLNTPKNLITEPTFRTH